MLTLALALIGAVLVGALLGLLALVIGSTAVLLVVRDVARGFLGRDVFEEIMP